MLSILSYQFGYDCNPIVNALHLLLQLDMNVTPDTSSVLGPIPPNPANKSPPLKIITPPKINIVKSNREPTTIIFKDNSCALDIDLK